MLNRREQALAFHSQGYNCAQCVLCAFEDRFEIEKKNLFRMAEAFGFGMGSMETCGAVTAMALAVGLLESDGDLEQPATKKICYRTMKKLIADFREKNGSVICREIKGKDTGRVLRSCDGCIEDAVALLEAYTEGR